MSLLLSLLLQYKWTLRLLCVWLCNQMNFNLYPVLISHLCFSCSGQDGPSPVFNQRETPALRERAFAHQPRADRRALPHHRQPARSPRHQGTRRVRTISLIGSIRSCMKFVLNISCVICGSAANRTIQMWHCSNSRQNFSNITNSHIIYQLRAILREHSPFVMTLFTKIMLN